MTLLMTGIKDQLARIRGVVADIKGRGDRHPLARYGAGLAVIAVFLSGAIYLLVGHDDMPQPRQVRELTIVNLVPPPPPPPPQQQLKPLEEKMIEQP